MKIKLTERIASLCNTKNESESEQAITSKECIDISAQLVNRLGTSKLKWELEDCCFRYLYPVEYKRIAELLHERRIDREFYIKKFVGMLRKSIEKEGVKSEIYGRPKHIYSIWRKMQKKQLDFNELFDIYAVRIIAKHLQDCYTILRIVHTYFHHLPDKFDDYIAHPKLNSYQSIHTVILGPGGKTVEIQIRTKKMHENAEFGIAAHWKYKENTFDLVRSSYESRIFWLYFVDWKKEMINISKIFNKIYGEIFNDLIYMFELSKDKITNSQRVLY